MRTWSPSGQLRARPFLLLRLVGLILVAAAGVTGCTSGESAPATPAADVPFEVEVNPTFVAVINRSTRPLTDIRVTIIPAGPLRFTSSSSRLEARGRAAMKIAEFRAQDNSPLTLRVIKPRSVLVEVLDADRKKHQLQVPWAR
jgi:hypothetical protein